MPQVRATIDVRPTVADGLVRRLPAGDAGREDAVRVHLGPEDALAVAAVAVSNRGGTVLVSATVAGCQRVVRGLEAAGRRTVLVDPRALDSLGAAVEETTQALVVDSITDAGELVDLSPIAEMCHSHDLVLIVDNGRLSRRVLRSELVGAALEVVQVATSPARSVIGGDRFPLSLVRRLLFAAGDHVEDLPLDRDDPEGGVPHASSMDAVDVARLAAHPAVEDVRPLDLERTPWATELHEHLGDLLVVRLTPEAAAGGAVLATRTSAAIGLAGLGEDTVLVHAGWPVVGWPQTVSTVLDRLLTTPTQDAVDCVARESAAELVRSAPWASQWTTRIEAGPGPGQVTARLLPSIWASLRVVRPFEVSIGLDEEGAADVLLARAAGDALHPPSADGLTVRVTLHRGSGPEPVDLGVGPEQDCSDTGSRTDVLDGASGVADLVIDLPWQAGGHDLGPDAGEALLLAMALDLSRRTALVAPSGWTLILEARRDLRPDERGGTPLRDAAVYLSVAPDTAGALSPGTLAAAWAGSGVLAALRPGGV